MGADLAQTLGNTGKAGSSRWPQQQLSGSSASATMEHVSSSYSTGAGSASSPALGVDGSATESFRSSTSDRGVFGLDPMGPDQFQRQYGDELLSGDSSLSQTPAKGKGKGRDIGESSDVPQSEFPDAWATASSLSTRQANQPTAGHSAPYTAPHASLQTAEDGAAVVSLLSAPDFQPEFFPTADDPTDHSVIDDVAPLTTQELQSIDSFRRHPSFAHETENKQRAITSRSLIPDIDSFLAQDGSNNTVTNPTQLRDAVLSNLPGAEDWIGVEDRYQEEVWGYLRPALEAASRELEESKNSAQDEGDGPAVRRLKMILRHMQQ
jgi:hypothetical protein